MTNLEIEFKSLLTESDFLALLPLFDGIKMRCQTNYYCDTADKTIAGLSSALRIRTWEDGAELTFKEKSDTGHLEYTQTLLESEATALIQNFKLPKGIIFDRLLALGVKTDDLDIWGELTTLRREMATPIGLMALDENYYGNSCDYELELEVTDPDKGEADFHDFLKKYGIPFHKGPHKVARAATELKK